jgi:hypothetical protein
LLLAGVAPDDLPAEFEVVDNPRAGRAIARSRSGGAGEHLAAADAPVIIPRGYTGG